MGQTLTSIGFSARPFRVWATGQTINAARASSTRITTALVEGMVLVKDPFGLDNLDYNSVTKGIDYTQALTGYLNQPKVLIVGVPPQTNTALAAGVSGTAGGGWVDVVDVAQEASIWCHDNLTLGDALGVVTADYGLKQITVFAISNQATNLTWAKCGVCAVTADTSSTAAAKRGSFNGNL